MSNQLTTCIEAGTAPGSRPAAVYRRIMAIGATVGSQFLAFVALAQDEIIGGGGSDTNPILDPALSPVLAFAAGMIVGVIVMKAAGGKKKD